MRTLAQQRTKTAYVCLSVGTVVFFGAPFVSLWRLLWLVGAIVCCFGALLAASSLSTLPRDQRRSVWIVVVLSLLVPTIFLAALIWIVHDNAA